MSLIIGLFIGAFFGVFTMCLMSIASGDGSDDYEVEAPCAECGLGCAPNHCLYRSDAG